MAIESVYRTVLDYDMNGVLNAIREELEIGSEVSAIVKNGLIAALDEIGRKFATGELYVPEMLVAAKAVKAGMEIVRPFVTGVQRSHSGTVIIGTVAGDLHDIGQNLVATMLEGGGFNVLDLGVDVGKDVFLNAVSENKADIVALSALLTTTMTQMKEVVALLKSHNESIRVMIGGAPVDQKYFNTIGADGYADDAAGAVTLARKLLGVPLCTCCVNS